MAPDRNGPLDRLASRSPLLALVAAAGGLGAGLLVHQLMEGGLPKWIGLPLISAAVLVAFGSTLLHWRSVDEAAREAHKSAWYWGGMAGTVGFGALAFVLSRTDGWTPPLVFGGEGPAGWFAAGAGLIVLAQVLGYLVAWAAWWLWRR